MTAEGSWVASRRHVGRIGSASVFRRAYAAQHDRAWLAAELMDALELKLELSPSSHRHWREATEPHEPAEPLGQRLEELVEEATSAFRRHVRLQP